jgi:DNA-directed RNA polymerase subunit RPC12/RpoP
VQILRLFFRNIDLDQGKRAAIVLSFSKMLNRSFDAMRHQVLSIDQATRSKDMKCPGQDMQYWNSEAIYEVDCPACARAVEFYKDDTTRSCSHCGHRFVNPRMDFGCAAYCKYAEQCIGALPEEFVGSQENLLKDKVAVGMKRFYKTDFKRIGFVSRAAGLAEKIGREEGVNLAIVLCAAYLKDISTGQALAAREILLRAGARDEVVDQVCALIEASHSDGASASPEVSTLADAFAIALLEIENKQNPIEAGRFVQFLEETLDTETGRKVAQATFRQFTTT